MRIQIVFAFLLSVFLFACKSGDNNAGESNEIQQETAVAFDGLPTETLRKAVQSCNNIDIIFYNLPISVNQSDQASVKGSLGFIGKAATPSGNCPAIGRIFYNSEEGTIAEADIHFSDQCQYLGFIENNQVKYANQLTPGGVNFFNQLISSTQNMPNN